MLEQHFVLRARYGVIGIAFRLRILVDDGSATVRLSRQVLEFRHAGIGVLVGVVDGADFLELLRLRQVLVFESQASVRQSAVAVVEEGVDGAGVDGVIGVNAVSHGKVVGVQLHRNVGVIQHEAKHGGVAVTGHELVGIGKVSVVIVGARGDARGYPGGEFRQVQPPLLAGIATEELVAQIAPDAVEHHVFAGADGVSRLAHLLEPRSRACFVEILSVQTIERGAVDRDGQQLAVHTGKNPMLVKTPIREARKPFDDALGIGVKDVGTIGVDEYAVLVISVIGIAANMVTLVDDEHMPAGIRQHAGTDGSSESSSDDEYVSFHFLIQVSQKNLPSEMPYKGQLCYLCSP